MEIEQRLAEIAATTPGIVSVYLFGSRADGRGHRESDVDVGVLLDRGAHPTAGDRYEERLRLIGRLAGPERPPVDLIVLDDVPPLLARHVVVAGQRLFCRDEERDHAFRRDTLLRAADLAPFLARTRRRKLESLAR